MHVTVLLWVCIFFQISLPKGKKLSALRKFQLFLDLADGVALELRVCAVRCW